MKIVFLAAGLFKEKGGIQLFCRQFIDGAIGLGHKARVVSYSDKGPAEDLKWALRPCGGYGIFSKPLFAANAAREISSFKPDLIVCGHVNFAWGCRLLQAVFKVPYCTLVYGVESWNLNGIKAWGLKGSLKIISISAFTRAKVKSGLSDYPEKNVVILAPTFDAEKFRPAGRQAYLADKLKLKSSDKIILTVTRLASRERYKGYDMVIPAMKAVTREFPEAKYILVGSGDDTPRINRLIRDNGMEEKVILSGFVPDKEIADYYNLCDCFVMPSTGEGFGIVYLEALSCGKPVIAGDGDGSKDALMNGKLGLLVNPQDIDQIAGAIIRVLKKDTDQRLRDADFLRSTAIGQFGEGPFREKLSGILRTLANA